MGLFSLFKKDRPQVAALHGGDADSRLLANTETLRQDAQTRQREIARATALKIDAIEAAMAFDIFNAPEPAWNPPRRPQPLPAETGNPPATLVLADFAST